MSAASADARRDHPRPLLTGTVVWEVRPGRAGRQAWRRGRDSNPRRPFPTWAVFKTAPINRSGTPPPTILSEEREVVAPVHSSPCADHAVRHVERWRECDTSRWHAG